MPENTALDSVKLHLVDSWEEGQDFLAWLGGERPYLGIDIETTGLNLGRDRVRLVQLGDAHHGWAVPFEGWGGLIREVVKRYDRPYVAHNLLFDSKFLAREGIFIPQHLAHDSMLMAHIWDPRYAIGLEATAARNIDGRARIGKSMLTRAMKGGGWDWGSVPVDHPSYWSYSALDTVLTALLAEWLEPRIREFSRVYEVELACLHVLREAALTGMEVDIPYCEERYRTLTDEMEMLAAFLPVEPSKDAQVVAWLEGQGVSESWPWSAWPRTDGGGRSVDDDVLAFLETIEPLEVFCARIRDWRKKSRLSGSYFKNLLGMNVDGIVRPSVKVVGARTGRMSVTEPALQTLPRGPEVRRAFIAREGHKLLLADYEQAELRVLASFAQATSLLEGFAKGDDAHTWVASNAYEVPMAEVTAEQRQIAKNAQFAKIYGAGNAKIALTAGVPVPVIDEFMIRYNEQAPQVNEFMHTVTERVRGREFHGDPRVGYVDTVLGRRLPVEKGKAYVGTNYLVQSSATADLLKLKLVELANAGLGDFIRLPVHDEILFECPDDCVEDASETIRQVMPESELFPGVTVTIDGPHAYSSWGDKYFEASPDREPNLANGQPKSNPNESGLRQRGPIGDRHH